MLTPEQQERAKELLDNPFWPEICQEVFQAISDEWRGAQSEVRREDLWRETRLLDRFNERLKQAANSDTLRQRALSRKQKEG